MKQVKTKRFFMVRELQKILLAPVSSIMYARLNRIADTVCFGARKKSNWIVGCSQ
jgi:hypothetical protein